MEHFHDVNLRRNSYRRYRIFNVGKYAEHGHPDQNPAQYKSIRAKQIAIRSRFKQLGRNYVWMQVLYVKQSHNDPATSRIIISSQ
jgi:hypothetical protein